MPTPAFRRLAARPGVQDSALALGLILIAVVPLGLPGTILGALDGPDTGAPVVVLQAAQALPLALRRCAPRVSAALVGMAFALVELTGTTTGAATAALPIALYSVGVHGRRPKITAAVAAVAYVALAVTLAGLGSPETPLGFATFAAVLALPGLIGRFVAVRQAGQAERVRTAEADAVRRERTLLARDLHDVVTHHVTAMVVQAESAAYLPVDDRAGREETLTGVGRTGRQALRELRELLGALDPASPDSIYHDPGSAALDQVVAQLRAAGHHVELLRSIPEPLLAPDAAAALRRVAQEAATNVLKHAPRAAVRVEYTREGDRVALRVSNPVDRTAAPRPQSGRGLAGSAARVEQVGGSFQAGPTADGQFVVEARLPEGER